MQLEIGRIVDGTVIKLTNFGAFIELEPKVNGLVHISEISDSFVADISNFLSVGDVVKVKILTISNGKIGLSIKQAVQLMPKKLINKPVEKQSPSKPPQEPAVYSSLVKKQNNNLTFEEMLNKFKKNSEEKLSDIKHNVDGKRNSYSKHR